MLPRALSFLLIGSTLHYQEGDGRAKSEQVAQLAVIKKKKWLHSSVYTAACQGKAGDYTKLAAAPNYARDST